MTEVTQTVVVGYDGSPESWTAVRFAAWEALWRARPLTLVHGYLERLPYAAFGWIPHEPVIEDVLADARNMLADAAKRISHEHPELSVHTQLSAGGGAGTLVLASRTASLVVVGARGHGGFAGLSLGSVAAQTAAHATCPVMDASATLIEESVDAGLVVVGCRGPDGFASVLLGSAGRDLIGHAESPVAVVHEHR
jgi:nucleotide-binding universal stress UspA family protein